MKIHFIRHAQTTWHLANKYAGLTDIELSQTGVGQAINLVNWGADQKISKIYSSDLTRAVNTAGPISDSLGIAVYTESRFREVDFGEVEGMNPQEFKDSFPLTWIEFQEKPATTILPGGQSGAMAILDAELALEEIFNSKNIKDTVIISHGTLIRILFCRLLGLQINDYRRIFPNIDNTSISTIWLPTNLKWTEVIGNCSLISFNKIP